MKLGALVFLFAVFAIVSLRPVYALEDPAQISDIVDIIRRIITLLAPAAAIAFFIILLVGGFQFLTSGGDPKSVAQARGTLTFGIIGILLVVGAWLVLTLIQTVTGVQITRVSF